MRTPENIEQRTDQCERYARVRFSSPLTIIAEECKKLEMPVKISELGRSLNGQELLDYLTYCVEIHVSKGMEQLFDQIRQTPEFSALEEADSPCPAANFEERVSRGIRSWDEQKQNIVIALGMANRADYFRGEVERLTGLIKVADSQSHFEFLKTLRVEKRRKRDVASRRVRKLLAEGPSLHSLEFLDQFMDLAYRELTVGLAQRAN